MKSLLITISLILMSCAPDNKPAPPWVAPPPPPWQGATVDGPLPNILVIGDSISGGYTGWVHDNLLKQYDVHHPNDNCRNTVYTLKHVDEWIWPNDQIIVWNNGLWDAVSKEWHDEYVPEQPLENYETTLAQYETNLVAIARRLKATGARVIFMTTTDIQLTAGGGFAIGKELLMNDIAKRVLPPEGIEVVDLYGYAVTIPNSHANQWEVHFVDTANWMLGNFVTNAILKK